MATRIAKHIQLKFDHFKSRRGQGFSLIEFLVAVALGAVSIALIGSLFISSYNVARTKSQELYLLQSLTGTFQAIEEDIQRAGFDGAEGKVLMLSGASDVIQVSGASEFGLVYYREANDYLNVRYKLDNKKLDICSRVATSTNQIRVLSQINYCDPIIDDSLINVVSFALSSTPIASSSAKSALWHLYIEAETTDSAYSKALKVDIKQRNWQ